MNENVSSPSHELDITIADDLEPDLRTSQYKLRLPAYPINALDSTQQKIVISDENECFPSVLQDAMPGLEQGSVQTRRLDIVQDDLQHDVDDRVENPLLLLLPMLRSRKPSFPITTVVNRTTIDLVHAVLSTKNHVDPISQLSDVDFENFVDFILDLLHSNRLKDSNTSSQARRLMLEMTSERPILLKSLFVVGVRPDRHALLGSGGLAEVIRGTHLRFVVALKRLRSPSSHNLCREVLVWKSLTHEYVLPFMGIFEDKADPSLHWYLLSPYMMNGTLSEWRSKAKPSEAEKRKCLLEVAQGLSYMHSEGIVHGDLHGGNVLVDDSFHALICDFGSSQHINIAVDFQALAYCRRFAAPELFGMDHDTETQSIRITPECDVYSFACLYYQIHYNNVPYPCIIDDHIPGYVYRGHRPSRSNEPPLSDREWKLMNRCWSQEAEKRPTINNVAKTMMTWDSDHKSNCPSSCNISTSTISTQINTTSRTIQSHLPSSDMSL